MSFFGPISPSLTPSIKRLSRLLLPLPLCLLFIGCDKQSSTSKVSHKPAIQQSATSNEATADASTETEDTKRLIDAADTVTVDTEPAEESDAGLSLMVAAKPDNLATYYHSSVASDSLSDDTLQATLIGDYAGMLPCSFCDSISVTLNLLPDGSVIKTNIYENPETPRVPLVEHGLYRQDNDVITVVYDNQDIEGYSIQNSHLIMIDDDKQPITDYTLARK